MTRVVVVGMDELSFAHRTTYDNEAIQKPIHMAPRELHSQIEHHAKLRFYGDEQSVNDSRRIRRLE